MIDGTEDVVCNAKGAHALCWFKDVAVISVMSNETAS